MRRSSVGKAGRTDGAGCAALYVRDYIGVARLAEPVACNSDPSAPSAERDQPADAPSGAGCTGRLAPEALRQQVARHGGRLLLSPSPIMTAQARVRKSWKKQLSTVKSPKATAGDAEMRSASPGTQPALSPAAPRTART